MPMSSSWCLLSGSEGSFGGPWCSTSATLPHLATVPSSSGTRLWPSGMRPLVEAGNLGEGGRQVDVLHDLLDRPFGDARAHHDQRHVDVRVIGRHLPRQPAVIAHVISIVGAEKDVGVAVLAKRVEERANVGDHFVDGAHRLSPQPELVV